MPQVGTLLAFVHRDSAGDVATRALDLTTVHLRLQEAASQKDNGASGSGKDKLATVKTVRP